MKWDRDHKSSHVEDRRGASSGGGAGLSAGGGMSIVSMLFSRFGWKGLLVGAVVMGGLYYCGGGSMVGLSGGGGGTEQGAGIDDEMKAFVGFVLDDAQATFSKELAGRGETYRPATLVLFTGQTPTACGKGSAAVGPFYCPGDEKLYIDLAFYQQLKDRLGAPGDFAQAYVIAHEVGHHLQNIYGVLGNGRDEGANSGSVRVELQADCYAGIWAHNTKKDDKLDPGDIEEALTAANAIGDDTLQQNATGTVRPETFSHGTSAQRMKWFQVGLKTGSIDACNTFATNSL